MRTRSRRRDLKHLLCAAVVATTGLGGVDDARAGQTFITDFSKNGNMQNNLQSSFPSGIFSPNNSFQTSFDITQDANGNNFAQLFGAGGIFTAGTYTVNVNVSGATDVYTLMNAYSPGGGVLATVDFIGTGGADQTFTLIDGTDARDFFHGGFANSINGTTTQKAFQIDNVQGGGGTGNSHTGLVGTYLIDEQHFALSAAFATQTLLQMKYTFNGSSAGTPILEGVTVRTLDGVVPEPSSLVLLGSGSIGLLGLGWARRRRWTRPRPSGA